MPASPTLLSFYRFSRSASILIRSISTSYGALAFADSARSRSLSNRALSLSALARSRANLSERSSSLSLALLKSIAALRPQFTHRYVRPRPSWRRSAPQRGHASGLISIVVNFRKRYQHGQNHYIQPCLLIYGGCAFLQPLLAPVAPYFPCLCTASFSRRYGGCSHRLHIKHRLKRLTR